MPYTLLFCLNCWYFEIQWNIIVIWAEFWIPLNVITLTFFLCVFFRFLLCWIWRSGVSKRSIDIWWCSKWSVGGDFFVNNRTPCKVNVDMFETLVQKINKILDDFKIPDTFLSLKKELFSPKRTAGHHRHYHDCDCFKHSVTSWENQVRLQVVGA